MFLTQPLSDNPLSSARSHSDHMKTPSHLPSPGLNQILSGLKCTHVCSFSVFCFPLRNQALLAVPNPHSSPGVLILQPSQQSHHSPFSEQVIQYMRLTCRQLGRSFLLSTSQGTASISSSPPFPSADSFLSRSVLGEAGSSMFADLPVGARLLQHCAGKIVFRKLPAKSRTPVLHSSPSLITCCFHDLPLTACIVTGVAVH